MILNNQNSLIDEKDIHKAFSKEKVKKLICTSMESGKQGGLIKTASVSNDQLLTLFSQMLSTLNIKCNDISSIEKIISTAATNKTGFAEENKIIKIISKKIKDSHYEVDVSKDEIKHDDKKLIMVSCYAKDAYLGRYIIKRNYFFSDSRTKAANQTYDELLTKMGSLKDRYYQEVIGVEGLTSQMKTILDGVISEISIEDDSLGTTVKR